MKVGLDYYGTISLAPRIFQTLAETLLANSHEVYIISACAKKNVKLYTKQIKHSHVPYTAIRMIPYEHHWEPPKLKLAAAQELGIELMIDDRADTCALLARHGIVTLQAHQFDSSL